jgi:outer membrane protein assembly factor BamB
MKARYWLLVAVGFGLLPWTAGAADWPQWRGLNRDGVSEETGLLKEWPKEGPKLLWQVKDLGGGYSTPAVVGDRLYLLNNNGADEEVVAALDVKDGKPIWSTRLGKSGPNMGPQYPGARSTPTVVGELLYALGSDGDLVCLETAKGEVRWHKDLRTDFGGKPGNWAYAESPLIDGDVLVCAPGGAEATVVALNRKTGDLIWKFAAPGADTSGYASAFVMELGGVKEYVQFLQKGLVGLDAKTGKLLWSYGEIAKGSLANIPMPVAHDGYVYSAAGMTGGGLVHLKIDKGEITVDPGYFDKSLPNSVGGAVRLGEFLYGANASSGLMCVEFTTGKVKWKEKGLGAGAVCFADGCLYFHGENGDVALVEATPEAYREKGRFTPPGQPSHIPKQMAWAYPVVADGRLYIRDLNVLWCYEVKAPKAGK